jgi:hypothetical protein
MRFIDTSTLKLVHYSDYTPDYAILSHTWGPDDEEVSYQEMTAAERSETTTTKPGFQKIKKTCEIAQTIYHLQYAWVDTCCIDKTSSAELSEAINSMFKWYQEATICFAFLATVQDVGKSFITSKWFTRGWTLQELIAPRNLIFFNETWKSLGSKTKLLKRIRNITGIESSVLEGETALDQVPVAVRMSWASMRRTKRTEDMAYCLMGLFDITMPMLYGEGTKAFLRLQEEIIKQSPDMSIFAWRRPESKLAFDWHAGILASSPQDFQGMRDIIPNWTRIQIPEFSVSNRGMKFDLQLGLGGKNGLCILPLGHGTRNEGHVGVYLRQVEDHYFVRAYTSEFVPVPYSGSTSRKEFHVAKTLTPSQCITMRSNALHFERPGLLWSRSYNVAGQKPLEVNYEVKKTRPCRIWSPAERILYVGPNPVSICFIHMAPSKPSKDPGFIVSCSLLKGKWRFELLPVESWPGFDEDVLAHYRRVGQNDGSPTQKLYAPQKTKPGLHRVVSVSLRQSERRIGFPTNLRLHLHESEEPPTDEDLINLVV